MVRQMIHIDEEKCNGCGLCVNACHEGAIDLVNGKAKLVREHFCDGLGDCLPGCPTGAITFEEREAPAYNEAAVHAAKQVKKIGSDDVQMVRGEGNALTQAQDMESALTNWPVQIKLAPIVAPYFAGAKLLIAADCTAYAYANFHRDFIQGKVCLIGCPKLDAIDYCEKLTEIIRNNEIQEVTVVRMQVPCCGGLSEAAKRALQNSGKFIPWQIVTIGIDGEILR